MERNLAWDEVILRWKAYFVPSALAKWLGSWAVSNPCDHEHSARHSGATECDSPPLGPSAISNVKRQHRESQLFPEMPPEIGSFMLGGELVSSEGVGVVEK